MIFNRKFETMPRDEMSQLQIERLQSTLNRVCRNVAFYKNRFNEAGINIEKIRSIEDMRILPFTTKDDLRQSYPYNMFAVPLKDIVRIHSTIGRTGKPLAIGYTLNDIHTWSELVARELAAMGVTEHDFVQIAFDYNMFTGAFGMHYGAEKLGASVIPSSSGGNIQRHISIMKDYKTSVLLSTPSYAFRLARNLAEMGIHPDELSLRIGIFGAEPWGEMIRARIEENLRVSAFNSYGVNEMMGPGVSGECEQKNGLHVNEDHYIIEVIDPVTLAPVPPGEEGELVFTTITREGFPLIRYRTGDVSSLLPGDCPCGRTTVRMKRVSTRTDDLIVINGFNIFPLQIEDILMQAIGAVPPYRMILDNVEGVDILEIQIEILDEIFADDVRKMLGMKQKIVSIIENDTGVSPRISLVEHNTGVEGDKRVIDRR